MLQVQPEILQSVDLEDVEIALRSCLLKLQYANASLGPLKDGDLPNFFHNNVIHAYSFPCPCITNGALETTDCHWMALRVLIGRRLHI